MKTFQSIGAFADHLATLSLGMEAELHRGLDKAAAAVEATAKSEFGEYQAAVGPYPEWEQLAESTQQERERLGYTPNDPLLRSGELRDSVGREVRHMEAVIGSRSPVMFYQELGTPRIPPRPVLGPALIRSEEAIKHALAGVLFVCIAPGAHLPALGD